MLSLVKAVAAHDGVSPLNEASMLALANGEQPRLSICDDVVGAWGLDDAPIEFMVHPRYRRQGRGQTLLFELLSRGEKRFWAHGDLPGARRLAQIAGLKASRQLLVLTLAKRSEKSVLLAEDVSIRPFAEADIESILSINAAAFANHPEQGSMDLANFNDRRRQEWFDPAGLFVAERAGELLGFHWTKRVGDVGEIYVLAVSPAAHGTGVGRALTHLGLEHLWNAGVNEIELYVEGDNSSALALYESAGFHESKRDVMYEKP